MAGRYPPEYAGLQPWKFSGKEEVSHGGLNLFDFGARLYDPALGVWTSTDPHAEDYYDVSHHAYCADNFINAVDPDGRDGLAIINRNNSTITIQLVYYYNMNNELSTKTKAEIISLVYFYAFFLCCKSE